MTFTVVLRFSQKKLKSELIRKVFLSLTLPVEPSNRLLTTIFIYFLCRISSSIIISKTFEMELNERDCG